MSFISLKPRYSLWSLVQEISFLRQALPRAAGAGYDTNRLGAPSSCLEGTRVEILRTIMEWLKRPITDASAPVYWVNGLAGIGKSTIARTVAEQAKNSALPIATFFFTRNNAALSNGKLFFTSIAFRLAEIFPNFMESICSALKADGDLHEKSCGCQVKEVHFRRVRSFTRARHLLVVVDALDECVPKDAETILRNVISRCTQVPGLRILITSRPENHITSLFKGANNIQKVILHDIENDVIASDIRHYLECQLKDICKDHKFPRVPLGWPSPADLTALVHKAGKLFIWAATAVKFIGDSHILNPVKQLQIILGKILSSQDPHAELGELYQMVLSNGLHDPDRLLDFQQMLGTVVLLRNPLSLESLGNFLGILDVDYLLIHIQSIIPLPHHPEESVEIYHPSFPDFITTSHCHERFRVDVGMHERWMALRCLDLLTTGLTDAVLEIVPWYSLNSKVENLTAKLTAVVGLEIQYACRFWASHLGKVQLVDEEINEALERFTGVGMGVRRGHLLQWVMVMSMMGEVHDAIRSLQGLLPWLVSIQALGMRMLLISP